MSFLDVSISGDVEKRSLKLAGVHPEEGSNEATDSVTLAVDIRPVRMKLKSKVGLEVTALVGIGVHPEVETVVAGDRLLWGSERLRWWAKRLRVSSLGGRCWDRVGIAEKLWSRIRIRFSRSLRLETVWGCRRVFRAVSIDLAPVSSIWPDLS